MAKKTETEFPIVKHPTSQWAEPQFDTDLEVCEDQDAAWRVIEKSNGSSGQQMWLMQDHPVAQAEYRAVAYGPPSRRYPKGKYIGNWDTSHLSRVDGTDLAYWVGRRASGYFTPIGRVMRMIPKSSLPGPQPQAPQGEPL